MGTTSCRRRAAPGETVASSSPPRGRAGEEAAADRPDQPLEGPHHGSSGRHGTRVCHRRSARTRTPSGRAASSSCPASPASTRRPATVPGDAFGAEARQAFTNLAAVLAVAGSGLDARRQHDDPGRRPGRLPGDERPLRGVLPHRSTHAHDDAGAAAARPADLHRLHGGRGPASRPSAPRRARRGRPPAAPPGRGTASRRRSPGRPRGRSAPSRGRRRARRRCPA